MPTPTYRIEQVYTNCLAQSGYYIISQGEVAIIDPLRETDAYLERLRKDDAQLKYIFETHFHADFVSGHLDLHKKTGADIVYGPKASPNFPAYIGKDEEVFKLGNITLTILHTPGHTMESACYLLKDEQGIARAVFTGDTLFLGDVGRPDLAQKGAVTKEVLAGILYDSLMQKIMPLPDDIIVYPGHGHGSACGKNMMKATYDTLGNQKKMNYALQQPSKEAFVVALLDGLNDAPGYFVENARLNKQGYDSFDNVLEKGLRGLDITSFKNCLATENAIILDSRPPALFTQGFIPRSINVGLNGQFAPWVGVLIGNVQTPLLLITEEGKEAETVTRLSRVGFDNILGYLMGGVKAWQEAGESVDHITRACSTDIIPTLQENKHTVIDVRRAGEYANEHITNAYHFPLDKINEWTEELRSLTEGKENPFLLHCEGGYRSAIAASVLKAQGIHNFIEIKDGMSGLRQLTNIPMSHA